MIGGLLPLGLGNFCLWVLTLGFEVDSHAHDGKALVAHLHSALRQPEAKPILRQPPAHIKSGIHVGMGCKSTQVLKY